ncbi:MAG: hypothetical protein AB2693_27905 [Candidatus Thiodiazotropha sp.]
MTKEVKSLNVTNCETPAKLHEPQEIKSNSDSEIDQKDSEPTEKKSVNETNCETQTELNLPTVMNLHHETNCGTDTKLDQTEEVTRIPGNAVSRLLELCHKTELNTKTLHHHYR